MDDHGDFDSVSWQREESRPAESSASFPHQSNLPTRSASGRRSDSLSSEPQAGEQADGVDLAGIGRDGSLEVTVDTPLKENDGTKDAYVSYLVTTHVSFIAFLHAPRPSNIGSRRTSSPFRSQISLFDDALQISSSSGKLYTKTIKLAPFPRYPRKTIWHMFGEIALAMNLHSDGPGLYIDSSKGVRYTPSCGEHRSLFCSLKPPTGMHR